jgi:hypothetical protein
MPPEISARRLRYTDSYRHDKSRHWGRTMLFTTHINVATLAQHVQGKTCKHNKSDHNFPHLSFSKKKQALGKCWRGPVNYYQTIGVSAGNWYLRWHKVYQSLA